VTLEFTIDGPVVGKNESRGLDFKHGRFFLPAATKLWMRHASVCAWAAAQEQGWPEPFLVERCSYLIFRWNLGGDNDRGDTILQDALQFTRWWTPRGMQRVPFPIGLYGNDSAAYNDGSFPSEDDRGGPRLEVAVTLRTLRAPEEAADLRRRWFANEERRKGRRAAREKAKRVERELAEIERRTGQAIAR
jgi:hypothetical protein